MCYFCLVFFMYFFSLYNKQCWRFNDQYQNPVTIKEESIQNIQINSIKKLNNQTYIIKSKQLHLINNINKEKV